MLRVALLDLQVVHGAASPSSATPRWSPWYSSEDEYHSQSKPAALPSDYKQFLSKKLAPRKSSVRLLGELLRSIPDPGDYFSTLLLRRKQTADDLPPGEVHPFRLSYASPFKRPSRRSELLFPAGRSVGSPSREPLSQSPGLPSRGRSSSSSQRLGLRQVEVQLEVSAAPPPLLRSAPLLGPQQVEHEARCPRVGAAARRCVWPS